MDADAKISSMIDEASSRFKRFVSLSADTCVESPIEKLMYGAFRAHEIGLWDYPVKVMLLSGQTIEYIRAIPDNEMEPFLIYVWPQTKIGDYRVDFLTMASTYTGRLIERKKHFIAIECDGHDFHEKSKYQAARDKARDRFLVRDGVPVMRFTGSEVWADAMGCAGEVVNHFAQKIFPQRQVA